MNESLNNTTLKTLIDKLHKEQNLSKDEWVTLITGRNSELSEYLFSLARKEQQK